MASSSSPSHVDGVGRAPTAIRSVPEPRMDQIRHHEVGLQDAVQTVELDPGIERRELTGATVRRAPKPALQTRQVHWEIMTWNK